MSIPPSSIPDLDRMPSSSIRRSPGYLVRNDLLRRTITKRRRSGRSNEVVGGGGRPPVSVLEFPEWEPPEKHRGRFNILPPSLKAVLETSENAKASPDFKIALLHLLAFVYDLQVYGIDGEHMGMLVALGDTDAMLSCSYALMPDPFKGHSDGELSIFDKDFLRSLKYYSQFDGFIGIDVSATARFCGRSIDIQNPGDNRPHSLYGRGTRHNSAHRLSRELKYCVVITLSQDRDIMVFELDKLIGTHSMSKNVRSSYIMRPLDAFDPDPSSMEVQ